MELSGMRHRVGRLESGGSRQGTPGLEKALDSPASRFMGCQDRAPAKDCSSGTTLSAIVSRLA
jgi:hypothetical protein